MFIPFHILKKGQVLAVLIFTMVLAGCSNPEKQALAPVPEIKPGILAGYLDKDAYPNSLDLVPPPPADGSAAQALDEQISQKAVALQGTPRWDLAAKDATWTFPDLAGVFECALGVPVTQGDTPYLYMLLRRTLADAGLSTYMAKNKYQRPRPFMANGQPICTPDEQALLEKDGSYPSGHTAYGWAFALILTEIAPDRTNAILARGRAYGESRIICNVHWFSDVAEGRTMGAAAVARLHADKTFLKDLEMAKKEYAQLRAKGLGPSGNCRAEADALSGGWL